MNREVFRASRQVKRHRTETKTQQTSRLLTRLGQDILNYTSQFIGFRDICKLAVACHSMNEMRRFMWNNSDARLGTDIWNLSSVDELVKTMTQLQRIVSVDVSNLFKQGNFAMEDARYKGLQERFNPLSKTPVLFKTKHFVELKIDSTDAPEELVRYFLQQGSNTLQTIMFTWFMTDAVATSIANCGKVQKLEIVNAFHEFIPMGILLANGSTPLAKSLRRLCVTRWSVRSNDIASVSEAIGQSNINHLDLEGEESHQNHYDMQGQYTHHTPLWSLNIQTIVAILTARRKQNQSLAEANQVPFKCVRLAQMGFTQGIESVSALANDAAWKQTAKQFLQELHATSGQGLEELLLEEKQMKETKDAKPDRLLSVFAEALGSQYAVADGDRGGGGGGNREGVGMPKEILEFKPSTAWTSNLLVFPNLRVLGLAMNYSPGHACFHGLLACAQYHMPNVRELTLKAKNQPLDRPLDKVISPIGRLDQSIMVTALGKFARLTKVALFGFPIVSRSMWLQLLTHATHWDEFKCLSDVLEPNSPKYAITNAEWTLNVCYDNEFNVLASSNLEWKTLKCLEMDVPVVTQDDIETILVRSPRLTRLVVPVVTKIQGLDKQPWRLATRDLLAKRFESITKKPLQLQSCELHVYDPTGSGAHGWSSKLEVAVTMMKKTSTMTKSWADDLSFTVFYHRKIAFKNIVNVA